MPLFEFTLRPLASVTPWGRPDVPDDLHLSWFGLTDGHYSMNCRSARLFQYTQEMCKHLGRKFPKSEETGDWTDYQVVRLYEDILELLPHVLEEVPTEVHKMIENFDAYRNWRASFAWVREIEDDEELNEQYYAAADWMGYRKLDSGYLIDGPNVWLWCHQNEIFLLWDNENRVNDGMRRWTAGIGLITMPVTNLLSEIESFHHRFMASMQDRVQEVVAKNPFSNVKIDIPWLALEHKEREQSLSAALAVKKPETDWSAVLRANNALKRPNKYPPQT